MSAVWFNDFTVDNLIDYARAARDLCEYVRVLSTEGFGQLVVPSRGAVPFIEAAKRAWHLEARGLRTVDQRVAAKYQMIASPFYEQLKLPFSADPQDTSQTTAAIRGYWSKVLAAIVRRDGTDPHLTFYKLLVERLAHRGWLDHLPRDLPQERFIFVDTVISGRAICEIFQAFEDVGLDKCHFLLIVDANGAKLAPPYRRVIDAMEKAQRCTLIRVRRLFTEDRGPAVSGVWSTVYPQVLNAMRHRFPWASDVYGAGSFYHQVSSSQVGPEEGIGTVEYNMPVTHMYGSLTVALFSVLQSASEAERVEADLVELRLVPASDLSSIVRERRAATDERMRRSLEYLLRDMRETIEELGQLTPLDKRTTLALAAPRVTAVHPRASVNVSSSHLVRVTLPAAEIDAFMREAERELAAGQDVLADDWFR